MKKLLNAAFAVLLGGVSPAVAQSPDFANLLQRWGPSTTRPSCAVAKNTGVYYFDTTLGYPVFCSGVTGQWVGGTNAYPFTSDGSGGVQLSGYPVNFIAAVTQNMSGTNTVMQDNVSVDASAAGSLPGGAVVAHNCRATVNGSGAEAVGAIHAVGCKGDVFYTGSGQYQRLIGAEGAVQITGTGTVSDNVGVLGYMPSNSGTMTRFYGFTTDAAQNTGTIGTWADYVSPLLAPSGGGTITTKYSLLNQDPNKLIWTQGRVLYGPTATQAELAPPPRVLQRTGRYYYGIQPSQVSANMNTLSTNMWYAPFYVSQQTTYTKIGCNVVTANASAAIKLAIYGSNLGQPANAPLATSVSLDASTTGDKEDTTLSVTLNPGFYFLAITSNDNTITVATYLENSALSIFGTSTSGGTDVTPYSAGANGMTAFPSSPALSYAALGGAGNAPKIWLRR